jgi:hypothetical protein
MKILSPKVSMTLVLALAAGAPALANNLDVNAGCAREGSFGLESIKLASNTSPTFVEDNSPVSEAVYRAEFWFNPQNMTMAHGVRHIINVALQEGAGQRPFQVFVDRHNSLGYRLFCQVARNNGTLAGSTRVSVAGNDWNLVRVEWRQSQGGGIDDGFCRVEVIDGPAAPGTAEILNQRNSVLAVGRVRMGLTGSLDAATVGSHCFDSFASFRTLAP